MSTQKTNINQLMGQLLDLQDQWLDSPDNFNWEALKALAIAGANFYNEGNGLSFQILAIDGMEHGEFHLRFLEYSLDAGFDPFKLVRKGSGDAMTPAFAHESLASAAEQNPWSARMQARLRELARVRFGSREHGDAYDADLALIIAHCGDSIPNDIVERIADVAIAA